MFCRVAVYCPHGDFKDIGWAKFAHPTLADNANDVRSVVVNKTDSPQPTCSAQSMPMILSPNPRLHWFFAFPKPQFVSARLLLLIQKRDIH